MRYTNSLAITIRRPVHRTIVDRKKPRALVLRQLSEFFHGGYMKNFGKERLILFVGKT